MRAARRIGRDWHCHDPGGKSMSIRTLILLATITCSFLHCASTKANAQDKARELLCGLVEQAQIGKSMNLIDAHVHVWTADTARYALAAGFKKEDMQPRSFTPEGLFKHCKPAGVGRINLIQMSFYGFDNSYMLDAIAKYPDVFVGTAVINPLGKDPERAMAELARRGVRAFRIH